MRLLPIAFLLFQQAAVALEPERPPTGQTVDESRQIALKTSVTAPCFGFPFGKATVFLQADELLELASPDENSVDKDDRGWVETHRQQAIKLLQSEWASTEERGCKMARAIRGNAYYLALRQIELGHAAMIDAQGASFSPSVTVRYQGTASRGTSRGGGIIAINLPSERGSHFVYMVTWWVD